MGNTLAIAALENAAYEECVHNSRLCVETHCPNAKEKHKQPDNGRRKQPRCVETCSKIQTMY